MQEVNWEQIALCSMFTGIGLIAIFLLVVIFFPCVFCPRTKND